MIDQPVLLPGMYTDNQRLPNNPKSMDDVDTEAVNRQIDDKERVDLRETAANGADAST